MTTPRIRHGNRQATWDRQQIVMQRRASTGEIVVWAENRMVPIAVTKP